MEKEEVLKHILKVRKWFENDEAAYQIRGAIEGIDRVYSEISEMTEEK